MSIDTSTEAVRAASQFIRWHCQLPMGRDEAVKIADTIDALAEERNRLVAERDEARADAARLTRERDEARAAIERETAERDRAWQRAVDAWTARAQAAEADAARLREAVDTIRTIAATAHRHRSNKGKEADFLAVIEDRARAALTPPAQETRHD